MTRADAPGRAAQRSARGVVALLGAGASLLLAATGCASGAADASRRASARILGELSTQVETERAAARAGTSGALRTPRDAGAAAPAGPIGLEDALRLAAGRNRDLLTARERLELSAIALQNARRAVSMRLSGSLDYLLTGGDDVEGRRADGASLSATDVLPTGGELTVGADVDRSHGTANAARTSVTGGYEARLRQPLLRGAGYETSHEVLTAAQRQALYDVRAFELERQDLALRVQREFYGLVADAQVIENRQRSLENFEFLRRRSERLFDVGRVSEVDKFRAAREFLTAENALVDAKQSYDTRLDRFKILLGLDTDAVLEIAVEVPASAADEPSPDLEGALRVAMANRLDLMTARDEVTDAERAVRIADRDLLPDLSLEAAHARNSETERRVENLTPDRDSYSVGIALELPLDRVRERGAVRAARIGLTRARRALTALEDNVVLQVRTALRDVRSARNSLAIQERIVASEEKNAKVARLRFEQGEIGNRDLTDALIGLADARDRLVREQVNVETARLQLLRELGVLVIREDGTWRAD